MRQPGFRGVRVNEIRTTNPQSSLSDKNTETQIDGHSILKLHLGGNMNENRRKNTTKSTYVYVSAKGTRCGACVRGGVFSKRGKMSSKYNKIQEITLATKRQDV